MDRISALPEELLVHIVSSISLVEGIRIGAVSRPCRDLWQFSTGSLNFDASNSLMLDVEKLLKEREGYVEWITRILNSHKAPTIDELRVCCDLTREHSRDIDRWIEIASMKRVKRLELDFGPCINKHMNRVWNRNYQFGSEMISGSLSFLTSLRLIHVGVSGRMLESFLFDCPSLETLHVSHSEKLTGINVCGPSLRLKHLHISFCNFIRRIEVYAPNLVSFEYGGGEFRETPSIDLKYVPQLGDVCYGPYDDRWEEECPRYKYSPQVYPRWLASCASNLVNLSVIFWSELPQVETFPKLPNLRYVTFDVRLQCPSAAELISLLILIPSSPLPLKLNVELNFLEEEGTMKTGKELISCSCCRQLNFSTEGNRRRQLDRLMDQVHKEELIPLPKTLREVEISGFVGSEADTCFLMYLVTSPPNLNLDHLVIDPRRWGRAGRVDQQQQATKKLEEAAGALAHYLLSEFNTLPLYVEQGISRVSFGTAAE